MDLAWDQWKAFYYQTARMREKNVAGEGQRRPHGSRVLCRVPQHTEFGESMHIESETSFGHEEGRGGSNGRTEASMP